MAIVFEGFIRKGQKQFGLTFLRAIEVIHLECTVYGFMKNIGWKCTKNNCIIFSVKGILFIVIVECNYCN